MLDGVASRLGADRKEIISETVVEETDLEAGLSPPSRPDLVMPRLLVSRGEEPSCGDDRETSAPQDAQACPTKPCRGTHPDTHPKPKEGVVRVRYFSASTQGPRLPQVLCLALPHGFPRGTSGKIPISFDCEPPVCQVDLGIFGLLPTLPIWAASISLGIPNLLRSLVQYGLLPPPSRAAPARWITVDGEAV